MTTINRGFLRLVICLSVYLAYLCLGALVFSAIEEPEERRRITSLRGVRNRFMLDNPCVSGVRILCISVKRSVAQEIADSRELAKLRYNETALTEKRTSSEADRKMKITLAEAMKILDVNELDKKAVNDRYQYLFRSNERAKGGSFYVQSKIVRAKQRIKYEMDHSDKN